MSQCEGTSFRHSLMQSALRALFPTRKVKILNKTYGCVARTEHITYNGNPRCKWEDIIRVALKETRREVVDWINLTEDRIK